MDIHQQQLQRNHMTTTAAVASTTTTKRPAIMSPAAIVSRNGQVIVTQKSNHVGTVLLYGIPIVSLYIEAQERLCLAQISNTLLKHFSYNEIHNRRVALGITCVQCTPVQLEILRRAGAMPVSSRRCGMITRREAERLCKSFLGDNAPPRLPDDFAFNVHHKCAWGCHGAFLPARYNSSRAKCIKCNYCGMFFSPNKFIFHSHRISAGDKYVQPDAANFNSWRRHMLLSGQPPEEIVHAWEDVKAMFNGGTRKRLMGTSSNNNNSSSRSPLATATAAAATSKTTAATISASHSCESLVSHDSSAGGTAACLSDDALHPSSPKRVKEQHQQHHQLAQHNIASATVRPVKLHQSASINTAAPAATASPHELPLMPFSRSFMMDYMWHAHAAQNAAAIAAQQQQKLKQYNSNNNNNGNNSAFSFPNCSLPWIKAATVAAAAVSVRDPSSVTTASGEHASYNNSPTPSANKNFTANNETASASASAVADAVIDVRLNGLKDLHTAAPVSSKQLVTVSAFKPVLQQQHHHAQQHHPQHVLSATEEVTTSAHYATPGETAGSTITAAAFAGANNVNNAASRLALAITTTTTTSAAASATTTILSAAASSVSTASAATLDLTVHANLCTTPTVALFGTPRAAALSLLRDSNQQLQQHATTAQNAATLAPILTKPMHLIADTLTPPIAYIKESNSPEEENNVAAELDVDAEDDEMVDIETTEEEAPLQNLHLISARLASPNSPQMRIAPPAAAAAARPLPINQLPPTYSHRQLLLLQHSASVSPSSSLLLSPPLASPLASPSSSGASSVSAGSERHAQYSLSESAACGNDTIDIDVDGSVEYDDQTAPVAPDIIEKNNNNNMDDDYADVNLLRLHKISPVVVEDGEVAEPAIVVSRHIAKDTSSSAENTCGSSNDCLYMPTHVAKCENSSASSSNATTNARSRSRSSSNEIVQNTTGSCGTLQAANALLWQDLIQTERIAQKFQLENSVTIAANRLTTAVTAEKQQHLTAAAAAEMKTTKQELGQREDEEDELAVGGSSTNSKAAATTSSGGVLFEALTFCNKHHFSNNNNSNMSNNFNNNIIKHQNSNEFWNVASRLCPQHPLSYEVQQQQHFRQQQQHQTQQHQQNHNMPLFYMQQQQKQQQQLSHRQQNDFIMGKTTATATTPTTTCSINNFRYFGHVHEGATRANGVG